jgi:hypothetical protein
MKKTLSALTGALALGALVACSSGPKLSSEPMPRSGYLPNYDLLRPVPSGEKDARVWRYRKDGIASNAYTGIMIDPIYVNQPANGKGITPEVLAKTKEALQESMVAAVQRRPGIRIVTQPGPGVAVLSVGITGAEMSNDSLKPWNITPVGLALNGVAYATGVNSKTPALLVESKITDSQTKELLSEAVATVEGESFRTGAGSVEAFTKMAEKAVRAAMRSAGDTTPTR